MLNHHKNDRTSPHVRWLKMARPLVRQPFRTLSEPYRGVKQTGCLLFGSTAANLNRLLLRRAIGRRLPLVAVMQKY